MTFSDHIANKLMYFDMKFRCFLFILHDFTAAVTLLLDQPSFLNICTELTRTAEMGQRPQSKARFHVTVRTKVNKSVGYFIVRRSVNFWCSEC